MLVEYKQLRSPLDCPSILWANIERMDLNPGVHEELFKEDLAVGLYVIEDRHLISGAILRLDERALSAHDRWALGSPLVHQLTVRDPSDVVNVMRCEWIDDKLHHPKAQNICVQQIFAYRMKCYMRKLFNPNYIKTPQLVVLDISTGVEDRLQFISLFRKIFPNVSS